MASYRNWNAVDAWFRRGGAMKDRRSTRGVARNSTSDYLEEYYDVVSASDDISEAKSDILADDDNGPVAQSG